MTSIQELPKKKLIVFCDGTWNRADQKSDDGRPCPTNVSKLFEATCPTDCDGAPQIAHYVPGVGTRFWERVRGGGFGYGISDNIKNAYQFICSNYRPDDEIFLFGFSRGAYTARSVAGLINNMGILKRTEFHLLNEAYRHYKNRSPKWTPSSHDSQKFRKDHSWGNESISFIGVWDTVGALGAPYGIILGSIANLLFKCKFHDVKLSKIVKSGYHALAVDERRWPFRPSLWVLQPQHNPDNFEQKWFPGVHSDVGGGYSDCSLSDISLKWMAEKAKEHGMGVALTNIACRGFSPNVSQQIKKSQTLAYRFATLFFVKLPGMVGLAFPAETKALLRYVQMNGDYIRRIVNSSDIHPAVWEKKAKDPSYHPPNVPNLSNVRAGTTGATGPSVRSG